jgi:hypothetical protein
LLAQTPAWLFGRSQSLYTGTGDVPSVERREGKSTTVPMPAIEDKDVESLWWKSVDCQRDSRYGG